LFQGFCENLQFSPLQTLSERKSVSSITTNSRDGQTSTPKSPRTKMSDRSDSVQQSPRLNNKKQNTSQTQAQYIAAAFDGLKGKWEFDRWIIDYKSGGEDKRFRGRAKYAPKTNEHKEQAEYMYREYKPQKLVDYAHALGHNTIWRCKDDPSKPIELFCIKDGKATGKTVYQMLYFEENKIEEKETWGSLSAIANFEVTSWGRYSGFYKFEFKFVSPQGDSGDRTVVLDKFVSLLEVENASEDLQIMTHYERPADEA
jgi:hypothetical protein